MYIIAENVHFNSYEIKIMLIDWCYYARRDIAAKYSKKSLILNPSGANSPPPVVASPSSIHLSLR